MVASMSGTVAFEEAPRRSSSARRRGRCCPSARRAGRRACRWALPLIEVLTYQAPCLFSSGVGRQPPSRGYFTAGFSSGVGVERGVGRAQRRDDLLHGVEIIRARVHAELLGGVAQIGDAGFSNVGMDELPSGSLSSTTCPRHARACPGNDVFCFLLSTHQSKAWMAGTSPAMTQNAAAPMRIRPESMPG